MITKDDITISVSLNYYWGLKWLTARNHAVLHQRDGAALCSAEANFLFGNFGISLSKHSKGQGYCVKGPSALEGCQTIQTELHDILSINYIAQQLLSADNCIITESV